MNIETKNYYIRAIDSAVKSGEVREVLSKCLLFTPVAKIDALAEHISDNYLYPVVAQGYKTLGSAVSLAAGLVSKNLGKRVKTAWTDPLPSSVLITASNWAQKLTSPIAACQPWQYPILRPLSQLVIGLARLADIGFKDMSAIFEVFTCSKKVFTSRPHEAFNLDQKTISGKIARGTISALYGVIWIASRVADISIRFFQAIANKIRFGTPIADTFHDPRQGVEIVKNHFIEKIQAEEAHTRNEVVGGAVSETTKKVLRLATSVTMNLFAGCALWYAIGFPIQNIIPINESLVKYATIGSFFSIKLLLEECIRANFIIEFIRGVSAKYDPKDHTIFYKKNLISGVLKHKKIESYANKRLLNNNS